MSKTKDKKAFEVENKHGFGSFANHLSAKHETLNLPKGNVMNFSKEEHKCIHSNFNQGESYKQNSFGVFTNGDGQENWIGRYNELLKMFS